MEFGGVRSFGTTIEDVTKYGGMCAKGLQDGGLFTVGKHFQESVMQLSIRY